MCLLFTISLKFLQQPFGIETSLTAKVIVSIIFSIKKLVFLKNIDVIIMSEDTPECAKLHHLKKLFSREHMPPNPLSMCSKTRGPQITSKMIPQ